MSLLRDREANPGNGGSGEGDGYIIDIIIFTIYTILYVYGDTTFLSQASVMILFLFFELFIFDF